MIMDAARAVVVLAGVAVSAMLATVVVLVIGLGTIADDTSCFDNARGNGE